jgi:predicted porin
MARGGWLSRGQPAPVFRLSVVRQTDNSEKRDIYEASTSYQLDSFNLVSVMYGYAHDRAGQGKNAQQIGLTYEYFLSKATSL